MGDAKRRRGWPAAALVRSFSGRRSKISAIPGQKKPEQIAGRARDPVIIPRARDSLPAIVGFQVQSCRGDCGRKRLLIPEASCRVVDPAQVAVCRTTSLVARSPEPTQPTRGTYRGLWEKVTQSPPHWQDSLGRGPHWDKLGWRRNFWKSDGQVGAP